MSHGVQAEVVYRCDTCQQTFANRGNLKIHERHVHNDERLFSCDVCTKTFKRKKDVIRHQRQVTSGGISSNDSGFSRPNSFCHRAFLSASGPVE